MYSNLYLVLIKHKLPLKIDFRKNHFTSHVLISLKSLMKKNLDNDYFSCLIFIELQKTFYTVNYDVRLAKLQIISPKELLHYQRVACSLRFNVMSIFVSSYIHDLQNSLLSQLFIILQIILIFYCLAKNLMHLNLILNVVINL